MIPTPHTHPVLISLYSEIRRTGKIYSQKTREMLDAQEDYRKAIEAYETKVKEIANETKNQD